MFKWVGNYGYSLKYVIKSKGTKIFTDGNICREFSSNFAISSR